MVLNECIFYNELNCMPMREMRSKDEPRYLLVDQVVEERNDS